MSPGREEVDEELHIFFANFSRVRRPRGREICFVEFCRLSDSFTTMRELQELPEGAQKRFLNSEAKIGDVDRKLSAGINIVIDTSDYTYRSCTKGQTSLLVYRIAVVGSRHQSPRREYNREEQTSRSAVGKKLRTRFTSYGGGKGAIIFSSSRCIRLRSRTRTVDAFCF